MDLLLQAARVLELEHDSSEGDDRVPSKSARGTFFQHSKSKRENDQEFDESQLYNGSTSDDLQMAERTSRRVGGVGTREVHNQLEKNRRKQLREFFTHLQQCVPSLENKRVATQSILQAAIKHIKNLKKKDVEQEREIQTLARRKCDLKKRYNLELNKCTEEQQHIAGVLLKVIKSNISVLSDGHTSDSTSTASECPSLEDDFSEAETNEVQQSVKTTLPVGICEGRKRKLKQAANPTYDGAMIESASNNPRTGAGARSLVSSSSIALKHMLEQRKRNQTAVEQAPSLAPVAVQTSSLPTRGPGSLTYSYPMITTHLASSVRPSVPSAGHIVTQNSLILPQSSIVAGSMLSKSPSATSAKLPMQPFLTKRNKKGAHIRSKGDNYIPLATNSPALPAQIMSCRPLQISSTSPLTLAQSPLLYPSAIKLVQPMTSMNDVHNVDISVASALKTLPAVSSLDLQSFNYLGQAVLGNSTGVLALESHASIKRLMDTNISSHKMMPTVIPLSLAPMLRTIPASSGLSSHMLALGSSPLTLCSSAGPMPTSSIADVAAPSLLSSNMQLPQGTNYLLTSSPATTQQTNSLSLSTNYLFTSSPVTTQQNNSLSLSSNTARIAALLAASSPHGVLKPVSPMNSMSSTLCPSSIAIPVSMAQSLMPVSLTNDQLSTKTSPPLTPGSPLRIFTPLSQSSVLALANGSSLMPAVVQLESSNKVALLHNLIHSRQLHVQNSHHILAQPIVVMATPETDFGAAPSNVTTTSSNVS